MRAGEAVSILSAVGWRRKGRAAKRGSLAQDVIRHMIKEPLRMMTKTARVLSTQSAGPEVMAKGALGIQILSNPAKWRRGIRKMPGWSGILGGRQRSKGKTTIILEQRPHGHLLGE
jgi:hypothetical protein